MYSRGQSRTQAWSTSLTRLVSRFMGQGLVLPCLRKGAGQSGLAETSFGIVDLCPGLSVVSVLFITSWPNSVGRVVCERLNASFGWLRDTEDPVPLHLASCLSASARNIRYRHLSSVLIHIVPWCLCSFLSELLLSFCPALRLLIDSLYHGSRAGSLEERGKHPTKIAIREPSLLGSHLGTNRSQGSFIQRTNQSTP